MHEIAADLARLQEPLDASYAQAGPHLLRIHEPERRLDAEGMMLESGAVYWRLEAERIFAFHMPPEG